jgi:prepilin-type N-terminal cleavage/methylation domain-containing protein
MRPSLPQRRRAFTLIELLVVIGIIVLLASILIPTISHIRTSVHQSATAARVQALMSGIEQYFHQFNAYPGPVPDNGVLSPTNASATPPSVVQIPDASNGDTPITVTGTENLTLGLSGGLSMVKGGNGYVLKYDAAKVDKGAFSLNPFKPATRYGPYVEGKAAGLEPQAGGGMWKSWKDAPAGEQIPNQSLFADNVIPEYVDAYPDAMPILYMRAVQGVSGSIEGAPDGSASGVTAANAAYDPSQLQVYVFPAPDNSMGSPSTVQITKNGLTGGTADPQVVADFANPTGTPPTSPANYFGQYTAPAKPRSNSYLLITAGPDRKYMTHDDTINNGSAVK